MHKTFASPTSVPGSTRLGKKNGETRWPRVKLLESPKYLAIIPVNQTVQRLEDILKANGVQLFAMVDHSGEAQKAGLKMGPTRLLIFGNPMAGTPLVLAAPSTAIDLP